MPRDSGGNYSLPAGYLAVTGQTIEASQHNPPLEDLASGMTNSLPRSGVAAMTGVLKGYGGTVLAPSFAFASALTSGLFPDGTALGLASVGEKVGFIYIGAGMDWWLPTAPPGWYFAYGQACTSATPLLRQKWIDAGNLYGTSGGGDPLFPDKRNRMSIPKGDMGGADAARVTNAVSGIAGATLGAVGGEQAHTLLLAEMATHNHGGVTGGQSADHTHTVTAAKNSTGFTASPSGGAVVDARDETRTTSGSSNDHTHTIPNAGGNTAHNNMPPGIVCNYIIYAGA